VTLARPLREEPGALDRRPLRQSVQFLNRLQVNNRLIVFDLQKLNSHPRLQSVYFYVIRQILDAKLKNPALRKMYVVDEGHRFFNDDLGSGKSRTWPARSANITA